MACVGNETRLIDCMANPLGTHNCAHSEDASVQCPAVVTTPPPRMLWPFDTLSYLYFKKTYLATSIIKD